MKRILYTILAALFSHAAFAQLPAKLTDRFLVKTDLLGWAINNAYNAGAEARLTRHLSLSVSYYNGSRQYSQEYSGSQFAGWMASSASVPVSIPGKGIVNSSYAVVSLRNYFGNVVKAPFGFYGVINYGYGRADIAGTYGAYLLEDYIMGNGNAEPGPLVNYTYKKVPMSKIMAGLGMQRLLFGHFYYDAAVYLDYTQISTGNDTDDKIISGVTRYYGANLVSFHLGNSGTLGLTGQFNISYLIY